MKILAIANINSQIMAVHIKTTEHFSKVIGTILIFLCLACKTKHFGTYSFHIRRKKSHFFFNPIAILILQQAR